MWNVEYTHAITVGTADEWLKEWIVRDAIETRKARHSTHDGPGRWTPGSRPALTR